MTDTFTAVTELIEQVTDIPAEEIAADAQFEQLDNWTSFAALRLLVTIEERFGIALDLREYLALTCVGELATSVSLAIASSAERAA